MISVWLLVLPAEYGFTEAQGATRLHAVNSIPANSRPELDHVLRAQFEPPTGTHMSIDVSVGIIAETATALALVLPVRHRITFQRGFAFEVLSENGIWRTNVIAAPNTRSSKIKFGDRLVGALDANIRFDAASRFPATIEAAVLRGARHLTVATERGGEMTVASLPLPVGGLRPIS